MATYALLSPYPPAPCGLAVFTSALLDHLPRPGDQVAVVRVLDGPAPPGAHEVVHDLVAGSAESAAAAAEVLNRFDVVIVQHDYGVYGGPDGQDVVALLNAVHVPSIVILHTVLAGPTPRQRAILDEIISAASAVVTMTRTARSRLLNLHGADPKKIWVIPHGADDNRIPAPPAGDSDRPTVLTWGLLRPGLGIEHAVDAVARLRDDGLDVDYQVIGPTHPRELSRDGEAYRRAIEDQVKARGVEDRVHFDDRFQPPADLRQLIGAADVVLLPYDSLERVTSGVLAGAVTAGKPVVSTRFPHAAELLGAGLLVGRQDPAGMARALARVLTEPALAARMSTYSADLAPQMLWPAVARAYAELAARLPVPSAGTVA